MFWTQVRPFFQTNSAERILISSKMKLLWQKLLFTLLCFYSEMLCEQTCRLACVWWQLNKKNMYQIKANSMKSNQTQKSEHTHHAMDAFNLIDISLFLVIFYFPNRIRGARAQMHRNKWHEMQTGWFLCKQSMSWGSSVQWSWQRLFMRMPRRKERSWLQPNSTNGMFHGFSVNYIFYYSYRINLCAESERERERELVSITRFSINFQQLMRKHTHTAESMWVAETKTPHHLQCN